MCFQLFLFSFVILISMEEFSNLWKIASYKYFRPLCYFSSKFWEGSGTDHTVFGKNCESFLYNCVPDDFYFVLRSSSGGGSTGNSEEWWNLSIFSSLDPFLQFVGQGKELLILDFQEINRTQHVVLLLMVFNL